MKKTLIAIVVTALACFCVVGTTLAFLVDETDPIVNTFTFGDINITLTESTGTEYKTIPGATVAKDPKVTVKAGSEACYLFVKVEAENNTFGSGNEPIITYELDAQWAALENVSGVYYMVVGATTEDAEYPVLAGNQVTINGDITKTDLTAIKNDAPTLTFTAYAVQKDNVGAAGNTDAQNAAAAWAIANPTTNP